MKLILDTVKAEDIEKLYSMTKVSGVTSNPSIVAKEAEKGATAEETIRKALDAVKRNDPNGEFHIQVLSTEAEDIIREAEGIRTKYGKDVFVNYPDLSTASCVLRFGASVIE